MAKIICFHTKIILANIPVDNDYILMRQMEERGLGKIDYSWEADTEIFVWNTEEKNA